MCIPDKVILDMKSGRKVHRLVLKLFRVFVFRNREDHDIAKYYWGSNFIIRNLDILRKFVRLDFALPVLIP